VGYADLDDFKAFNDKYGFAMGDRVFFETGRIISRSITQLDFVGHVGGDDFVFITLPARVEKICRNLIKMFDREILKYYDDETRATGYIESVARNGEIKRFPLMSISIAVVTNCERAFKHFAEIVTVSTELKKYIKTLPGSKYLIDRRKDETPEI
jgi:diguanylate cyclase (GGDEF)-like protein